ncbi:MAG: CoA transferase [Bacillota bacterium]|nr:CoA transferase [Bacillota bacterium]
MGPLNGVRVIELGSFIAGPYCGMLLADFGAEVIKIEPPQAGDPMRQWGLPSGVPGRSYWWSVIGRNKKSVTIDLRHPRGVELVRTLAGASDVLVENFRPGTLEKWGLGYAEVRDLNPGLIVVRISGFGQTGPYRAHAGFASVAEAMAGLRYIAGYPDRPPVRVGVSIGDTLAGLFGALGAVLALKTRSDRKGQGQVVDVGLTDAVLAVMEGILVECSALGVVRERTGGVTAGIAPSNIYPTADQSWVVIGANADTVFRRLAQVTGRPELSDDPRFATHVARGQHQAELDALIASWTSSHYRDEIVETLRNAGVPAGPVNSARDVIEEPHFRDRGIIACVDDPELGRLTMQGVVPFLSLTPGQIRWAGPTLGQHTDEVLREIVGLGVSEIEDLRVQGVI